MFRVNPDKTGSHEEECSKKGAPELILVCQVQQGRISKEVGREDDIMEEKK